MSANSTVFFHAIACSPELIPPSVWMPAIWGSEAAEPTWPDMKTGQAFIGDVMQHYNKVMTTLNQNDCSPLFLEEDTDNGTRTIPDDWCIGFQSGIGLIDENVDKLVEHPVIIAPIILFSSDKLKAKRETLSEKEIDTYIALIPACMLAIQKAFGVTITSQAGTGKTTVEPFTHDKPRVGRNDSCPCGSGKKYKKCCGVN